MAKASEPNGAGFDFSSTVTSEEPVEMHLTDPGGSGEELQHNGKPLAVWVYGPDTEHMKAYERGISDKRLKIAQSGGQWNIDTLQVERERLGRVVRAVAKWDNFWRDGQKIEYSPEAVREFAGNFPWFLDQIDRFHQTRGNFFLAGKGQSKPSAPVSAPSST